MRHMAKASSRPVMGMAAPIEVMGTIGTMGIIGIMGTIGIVGTTAIMATGIIRLVTTDTDTAATRTTAILTGIIPIHTGIEMSSIETAPLPAMRPN